MIKKNILVVDDEEVLLKGIKFFLMVKNYSVTVINNGRDALELILESIRKDIKYDLIITDILMSELTGLDLLKVLKELNITIPVIIITGFSNNEFTKDIEKIDKYEIITKPFDKDTLLSKVEKVLNIYSKV